MCWIKRKCGFGSRKSFRGRRRKKRSWKNVHSSPKSVLEKDKNLKILLKLSKTLLLDQQSLKICRKRHPRKHWKSVSKASKDSSNGVNRKSKVSGTNTCKFREIKTI
jgi:hypothetical protein